MRPHENAVLKQKRDADHFNFAPPDTHWTQSAIKNLAPAYPALNYEIARSDRSRIGTLFSPKGSGFVFQDARPMTCGALEAWAKESVKFYVEGEHRVIIVTVTYYS